MALQEGRSEMTAFFNDGRYAGNEKESSKGDRRALCAAMVFSRMADMRVYAMEDGAGRSQNGESIPSMAGEEYTVDICRERDGGKVTTIYKVKSRKFYKIGDRTTLNGAEWKVCGVKAIFQKGELTFRYYRNRQLDTKEGNMLYLNEQSIAISKEGSRSVCICNGLISANSVGKFRICAENEVRMSAKRIILRSPDEVNICQE